MEKGKESLEEKAMRMVRKEVEDVIKSSPVELRRLIRDTAQEVVLCNKFRLGSVTDLLWKGVEVVATICVAGLAVRFTMWIWRALGA